MQVVVPEEFGYLYQPNYTPRILKTPDPLLRAPAVAVASVGKKHVLLAENMVRLMRAANGIGLAAPQIGVGERVLVMAPDPGRPLVLFNPVVIEAEGSEVMEEGCLSIPGLYGDVTRPSFVVVRALDRKNNEVEYEMEGMAARVVQHEIDHLDGILFIDKADPATLHWQHPRREDQETA